ncbi:hypothetical protein Phi39:1_gp32 [Cellulophaga phage phi39:1]|uniref:hypothetical protein n=1 Tax=Cellulophaga phage phi39:1 TaxID=1327993 RepID=UPI0003515F8B|nr:hypothetical protein Phi39:1_gp32 [Cellulophaga phage phi39:1]AGO49147.1 hypothetical protein Phi39:1_gp32 [Cellulophaga phage phi39:1]
MKILKLILLLLILGNWLNVQGQLLTENELSILVRSAEKYKADAADLANIVDDQKLIIKAQGVRLTEKDLTIEGLNEAIDSIKIAYEYKTANEKN